MALWQKKIFLVESDFCTKSLNSVNAAVEFSIPKHFEAITNIKI